MKRISKELIGASTSPIILSILSTSDSYGYEIVQKVKKLTHDDMKWKEASIYPVLKKMEKSGLIKSYWKIDDIERPRKYYTLLTKGNIQLQEFKSQWEIVYSVLNNLWSPA